MLITSVTFKKYKVILILENPLKYKSLEQLKGESPYTHLVDVAKHLRSTDDKNSQGKLG